MQRVCRLKRELDMLTTEPPPGITCWQNDERIDDLRAHSAQNSHFQRPQRSDLLTWWISGHFIVLFWDCEIVGGSGTPYEGGVFSLEIKIPERYPFEPPKMRFLTPIYHPNIDTAGRICYEALKLPPKGAWRPSLNLSTLLTSIQLLMAEPNPDDPLMADIASEFRYNKQLFTQKARKWTEEHAVQKMTGILESSHKDNVPNQNAPSRKRASSGADQERHELAKRTGV